MVKEILVNGKRISYRVEGKGHPVVLIHGFGETSQVWDLQVNFLKDSYRLILPDLPGTGQSEIIDDMSMEGLAEVIKSILDDENAQEIPGPTEEYRLATLIGHSMGGYIVMAFVAKYLERLSAFGLFHSTAYSDSDEKKAARRKGINFIEQHGAYEFLKTMVLNLFSATTRDERPELVKAHLNHLRNFSARPLVLYYRAMIARPDRSKLLEKTGVPVLFIIGLKDQSLPYMDMLKQSHLPEKSYIHILQESGHMGMMEEPSKANDILKKFLSETAKQSC